MLPTTALKQMSMAENYEGLCAKVIEAALSLSQKAISNQGRCTIALSGGSTPAGLYALMATRAYRDRFDWKNIHFFLGDERWVPTDSPRSNYKMIEDALFTKINFSLSNFHPIQTNTLDPEASASLYEKELRHFFNLKSNEFPAFDLVLLGLGTDGHTASLFPGNPSLLEKERLAISTSQPGIPEKRITLTLPSINHAQEIWFVVSGQDKADILPKVVENKNVFPANQIKPVKGRLAWFLDKAAASKLVLIPEK